MHRLPSKHEETETWEDMANWVRNVFFLHASLFFFFLLLNPTQGFAQTREKYDSVYHAFSGKGWATFHYFTDSKGDMVKDGEFSFQSKQIDSTCKTKMTAEKWDGQYKNNLKEGAWKYQYLAHKTKIDDIDSFRVNYQLMTSKKDVQGNFKLGKPTGAWDLGSFIYENGQRTDSVLSVSGKLNQAKFDGQFEVKGIDESGNAYIIGGEVKEGLLVGKWVFDYHKRQDNQKYIRVMETRMFEKGFLISLLKINHVSGDTLVQIKYPVSNKLSEYLSYEAYDVSAANVPLSLTYNDGYPRTSSYILEQKKGNIYLELALKELFQFEKDFFKRFGWPLGTNRMYYPLSSKEKKLLKEWPDKEFQFRKKIDHLEELIATNFRSRDNDTLQMIHRWTQDQYFMIQYMKPWNDLFALDEIEFYNREGILYDYAKDLMKHDTICYKSDSTCYLYKVEGIEEKSFLSYISKNLDERIELADSLQLVYENIIQELDLEDGVEFVKNKIVAKKKQLDSLYSSNKGKPGSHKHKLLSSIDQQFVIQQFDSQFELFLSNTNAVFMQKQRGDSLLFSLVLLDSIYHNIQEIFANKEKIDSIYTEYVFDPYTFNEKFPKRVKKRLYETVAIDLFENIVSETIKTPSIITLEKNVFRLQNIQKRLVFLVDKDTKKLERKLKKKAPIEEKLRLLKIE